MYTDVKYAGIFVGTFVYNNNRQLDLVVSTTLFHAFAKTEHDSTSDQKGKYRKATFESGFYVPNSNGEVLGLSVVLF